MILQIFRYAFRVLIFIGLLLPVNSICQTVFSNEDDLKKQANKLFEEEDFTNAYPLFSQLLSLYPKDAQYNYKFGTCLLFSSNDKGKAIPYIEYAAKRQKQNVDNEVFFYLGKAYHLNYRFADAIRLFKLYKTVASEKLVIKYDVERQIEMCDNGKKLLKTITDLSVLEKKEVPFSDFFRSYNLTEFNANLVIKPDEMKSSTDKKKKDEGIIYVSPNRNQIYYSSYGEDDKNGKDIFYVTRTPSGDLTKPTRLNEVINTKYDEDYAFLHPNGKLLYFCSKGHNSMGGYDIFKSEWNATSQSWGKPVNMDFAINTPDDDVLFISDSEDKSAYFSSRRENSSGKITVYKIKLDRKPLNLAIVSGKISNASGDKISKATITVTNVSNKEVVGIFYSNETDGSYTLSLPNGGKFMVSVETPEFKKASELVVIPMQQEIKPLKQEILLVKENDLDKIVINNTFDAQIDSVDLALATQYIKEKAALEVTPAEQEVGTVAMEETSAAAGETKKDAEKTSTPVSNTDIIDMAYQDTKETQKEANELIKKSDAAHELALQKNNIAIEKNKEAQDLEQSTKNITNQDEKLAKIDKISTLRKEASNASQEAALSLTLASQLSEQAKAKQEQADAELKYANELDNSIKAGASEVKMNELLARKEELDKKSSALKSNETTLVEPKNPAAEKQKEADNALANYNSTQQDITGLTSEAKRVRSEADKTKNKDTKQNLISQAVELEKEAETKKVEANKYSLLSKQFQFQADSLKTGGLTASSTTQQTQSSGGETTNQNNNPTQSLEAKNSGEKSPYVDAFLNKTHEAEKNSNEHEREDALAVIYQAWTDSLDKQISFLKNQLTKITDEQQKSSTENKISELQSSAEDKRQRAAESRSKVDTIKLKEAMSAASEVTSQSSSTATPVANTISPENIKGTSELNSYYTSRLNENSKIQNEYEKKVKQQNLYQDWAAYLYNESTRLRQEGRDGKANEAERESKEKQKLSIDSQREVAEIKEAHPELVASADFSEPAPQTIDSTQTTASNTAASSNELKTKSSPSSIETTSASVENTTNTSTKNSSPTQTENSNTAPSSTDLKPEATSEIAKTENITSPQVNTTNTSSELQSPTQTKNVESYTAATVEVPASITNKDEYIHYISLKNEAEWLKKNSERQNKQADELEKKAAEQSLESQKLAQKISESNHVTTQKNMSQKSDELDKQSLVNQMKADSLKKISRISNTESIAKNDESISYIQSLNKPAFDEIASTTGYSNSTTNTSTTSTETKNEPIAATSNSIIESTTNPSSTTEITPANTTTTSQITSIDSTLSKTNKVNPSLTEANIISDTSSTSSIKKTSTTSDLASNTISSEPISASSADVTNKSTIKNPVEIKNRPLDKTEGLKYYDQLFDKLALGESSYSPLKPIPIDAPLPEGLIFKVQIGAFRKAIPQNLFGGIKPVSAETTPQGLKRYTAGLFKKLATATEAKNQVKSLGYRDAFVVAFFNGKRISMNDAMAMAKENGENFDVSLASNNTPNTSTATSNTTTKTPIQPKLIPTTETEATATTEVKSIGGLFYTIQIGLFSNPVSSSQLFNISPINSEKTENGMIRYSTGRFSDVSKADASRINISNKGIPDAFVVAYYNGKRISLLNAKSMMDSQGNSVLTQSKQEYSIMPSDTATTETVTSSNSGVVFKVQVGAYKEEVPIEDANKLLKISSKGIKTFKDENGLLVYSVGEFMEYESAVFLKTQLVTDGFSGAFVIAFKNGIKVNTAEMIESLKNK